MTVLHAEPFNRLTYSYAGTICLHTVCELLHLRLSVPLEFLMTKVSVHELLKDL